MGRQGASEERVGAVGEGDMRQQPVFMSDVSANLHAISFTAWNFYSLNSSWCISNWLDAVYW